MATKQQIDFGKKQRSLISDSSNATYLTSSLYLAKISDDMIAQITKNKKGLKDNQDYKATNDVKARYVAEYKRELNNVLAESIDASWQNLEDFVGVKSPIKFKSEFEKLPKSVRDRLNKTSSLLIDSQVSDLEKNLFFTYDDAILKDLVDKEILFELEQNAEHFYTGGAVKSGSSKIAATYINHAETAYFALDSVSDELEALLYYNPDPKSAICKDLAGQYFPVNDPNLQTYMPPNHWNCKSTVVPVLKGQLPKGENVAKLNPSKTAKKSVQFNNMSEQEKVMRLLNEFKS